MGPLRSGVVVVYEASQSCALMPEHNELWSQRKRKREREKKTEIERQGWRRDRESPLFLVLLALSPQTY